MNNFFDTFDHFTYISGSKIWPSDDPEDSPFDTFTCKHCGASKKIEMYGSRYIDEPSFEDNAKIILREHLSLCEHFKKGLIMKITETIERSCCQKKDLLKYNGILRLEHANINRLLFKFCIHCGQIWYESSKMGPAGGVDPTLEKACPTLR